MTRVPRPGSLTTSIRPPISATTRRVIASPSPLPSARRACPVDSCTYSSNRCGTNSGAMPMPLSWTASVSSPDSGSPSTNTATPPWSVNLMAFETRLMSTRASACESRRAGTTSAAGWTEKASPLSSASGRSSAATARTISATSTSSGSRRSLPARSWAMSSRSLTVRSRRRPPLYMCVASSRTSAASPPG